MTLTIINPNVTDSCNTQELINQLIMNLDVVSLTPPERYAIANRLKEAAETACKTLASVAIKYALSDKNGCQPLAGQGKEFTHRGHVYQIHFEHDYNYAQKDELGQLWTTTVSEIAVAKKLIEDLQVDKKYYQAKILEKHSRLQPMATPTAFKFINSKQDGTEQS